MVTTEYTITIAITTIFWGTTDYFHLRRRASWSSTVAQPSFHRGPLWGVLKGPKLPVGLQVQPQW